MTTKDGIGPLGWRWSLVLSWGEDYVEQIWNDKQAGQNDFLLRQG
jgi:hypothetical protein